MKPLSNAPSEGRVNPIGIPILYLATDEKTAVAEVRQWIGKFVSVAQFKVLRDVQLIDCSLEYSEGYEWHEVELKPAEREHVVWRELGRAYSEPVSLDTRPTDYVPTQIIAEHFRAHGADGIVYQSAVGGGKNVALFDLSAADPIDCSLHYVRGVSLDYSEANF